MTDSITAKVLLKRVAKVLLLARKYIVLAPVANINDYSYIMQEIDDTSDELNRVINNE